MVYPLEVVFVPKSSTIMIEVGSSYTVKKPTPLPEVKTISEDEKSKLDEGVFVILKSISGLEKAIFSNFHQEKVSSLNRNSAYLNIGFILYQIEVLKITASNVLLNYLSLIVMNY